MLDLIPGGSSTRRSLGAAYDGADAVGDAMKRVDVGNTAKHVDFSAGKVAKVHATKSGLTGATRLRADELATGQRLEQLLGKSLKESAHEGAEFVDDLGRTFDALGGGSQASKFFNLNKFTNSITKHLRKSNDFTVIDLTDFTPSQIADVTKFLDGLPKSDLDRIIRIGF